MAKHYYPVTGKHGHSLAKTLCVFAALSMSAPLLAAPSEGQVGVRSQSVTVSDLDQADKQASKVIGVVIDTKTGDPIIGANVLVKGAGARRGVATDLDGKFEIKASPSDVLVISSIGYTTKQIKVGKQKLITVSLAEDSKMLGDVVVTAFGTGQKKETVTGAIQTVRPGDLKVPAANLTTAFAGRLAGVVAYQRSGEPGSNGANFFIRGVSSFSGANNPLIILDGVEVSQGDLNALDPDVIDSFSVLKDASATALYGARGANGVLIIKTKGGADLDRPVIGVRLESYMNTPIDVPKTTDAITFMNLYNEAVEQSRSGAQPYTKDKIEGTMKGLNPYVYPNVDWYNELFKNHTFNQKANINIRGGGRKITYFMNVNAVHETGMLKGRSKDFYSFDNNIDMMRYAFQNNIDFKMTESSKVSLNLNVQLHDFHGPITSNRDGGTNNLFGAIMQVNPVDFPIMYPKGDDEWLHWGGIEIGSTPIGNPMAIATAGYKDTFHSTVVANLNFEQKLDFLTKGLKFKGLFSFKNWSSTTHFRYQGYNKYSLSGYKRLDDGTYELTQAALGTPAKHNLGALSSTAGDRNYYVEGVLSYDRQFGKHSVGGLLVYNQSEYNNNVPGDNNLIATLPKRRMGMALRANYDYDHRYLLELNAGYTGSENFASGHRWGFFPSVSLGWNISREKFWEPLKKVVSNLKLRGSYGLVGNDQIGGNRFIYLEEVALNHGDAPSYKTGYGSATQSHKGVIYPRLRNEDITWEVGYKTNLGIDLQLFKSLNLTAEVFYDIRSNIFQQRNTIPSFLGVSGNGADNTKIYGNFGKVENKGLDISAEYNKQVNRDLTVQVKGTFTFVRNKILEYDEAPGKRPALLEVGKPLNKIWGLVADGLYIDEADVKNNPESTFGKFSKAAGDIKYVDQPDEKGEYDGRIQGDDVVMLGHPTVPEIIYGFTPSIRWKNFDFSFHLQGQSNVSLMMSGFAPFGDQERRQVLQWIADDHWSKDNQNIHARHPRLTQLDNQHNMKASSFWLRDASFLRLKTAEIGYTYKNARFYLSGTNLLRLSAFNLWDPEMGGGKGMSYPLQRTFNLGVSLVFK